MPIHTRFPLSWCAMLARSLSVKLPNSYKDNKGFREAEIFNTTFESKIKTDLPWKTSVFNYVYADYESNFFPHKGFRVRPFEAVCS